MPKKCYNCMQSNLISTNVLRCNYVRTMKTSTVVLRIKIRQLRYFLRLWRNTLRYVNFFLAPTVSPPWQQIIAWSGEKDSPHTQ